MDQTSSSTIPKSADSPSSCCVDEGAVMYLHVEGQVSGLCLLQVTLRVFESHLQAVSLRLYLTQLRLLPLGLHLLLKHTHEAWHSSVNLINLSSQPSPCVCVCVTFSSSVSFSFLSFSLSTAFSSQRRALAFRSLAPPEITPDFWNNVPSRATVWRTDQNRSSLQQQCFDPSHCCSNGFPDTPFYCKRVQACW